MGEHAKRSPSASSRWLTCTASLEAELGLPDETSEAAEEGTRAHELLERAIKARTDPVILEPDHPAAKDVKKCYDLVAALLDNPEYTVMSEVVVKLSDDCWGTVDLTVLHKNNIWIIDYKHGKGVVVEPDHPQFLIYGKGAMREFGWMLPGPVEEVTRTVVQPRIIHSKGIIRDLVCSGAELEAEYQERVQPTMDALDRGETRFVPSEEACRWCKVKNSPNGCDALQKVALAKVQSYFSDNTAILNVHKPSAVKDMTLELISAILDGKKLLNIFLGAVEKRARELSMEGHKIPGYKLVNGKANRVFTKKGAELEEFLIKELKLKKSQIYSQKLLGIPGLEKLIDPTKRGGKKKQELLESIITKPEGKPTLVKDDAPGTPIIESMFGEVKQEDDDPLA